MNIIYMATKDADWILLIKKAYGKAAFQVVPIEVTEGQPIDIRHSVEEYFVNDPAEAATKWLRSITGEPITILEMRKF